MFNQEWLVRTAQKSVPVFRWVIAAAATFALAAGVIKLGFNLATLMLLVGVLIVVAMGLIALHWISKMSREEASTLATFVAWALILLFIAPLVLTLVSATLDNPWKIRTWINEKFGETPPPTPPPRTVDVRQQVQKGAADVLLALSKVQFIGSGPGQVQLRNGINELKIMGEMERGLRDGVVDGNGKKTQLVGASRDKALQHLDQALTALQMNNGAIISDWQAAADAIGLSETNTTLVLQAEGFANLGAQLARQIQELETLQKYLTNAVAAGKGQLKDYNSAHYDADKNSDQIALRLQNAVVAMQRLQGYWDSVAKQCDSDGNSSMAANSKPHN